MQDVLWVPSDPAHFVTWGQDIRHYSVARAADAEDAEPRPRAATDHAVRLSATHVAVHVGTLQEPQYVRCAVLKNNSNPLENICVTTPKIFRCVDVWPGEGIVVAVGQAGGRVSFSSFRDGEAGHLLGHTLAPRTPRTCTGTSVVSCQSNHLFIIR